MQFKRRIRFRLSTLLGITAILAVWIAVTVRPIRYLNDATRIRALGGSIALGQTDNGIVGFPFVVFCRVTGRSWDLPCILTVDERCPASEPIMRIAGGIPTLTSLDLTRSDVDDNSFAHLAPLRKIQNIRVQGRPITNASMAIVGRWSGLRTASFHGTSIDDIGVGHLAACKQLNELSLRSTKLTDLSVDILASLASLTWLDVTNCNLTDAAIQRLIDSLPNCEVKTRDP